MCFWFIFLCLTLNFLFDLGLVLTFCFLSFVFLSCTSVACVV